MVHPNIFASLGDSWRLSCLSAQLTVAGQSTLILSTTPRPPSTLQLIIRNDFKNYRFAPQITTSLYDIIRLRSHVAWETLHEVIHLKSSLAQTRLTIELLKVDSRKKKVHFLVI